ncbi:hypothetical protein CPB84DRAFT_1825058 [Gymnopilus junonius]|uniref:Uncharacterized protein n=1 Tax=Gymnopilus junonius TaxID=109634 RepID=A0A9P5TMW3_GYMJU|nr:hypothetical protein CPB84DRAFT_1825058 [Gymnopilus junonius]
MWSEDEFYHKQRENLGTLECDAEQFRDFKRMGSSYWVLSRRGWRQAQVKGRESDKCRLPVMGAAVAQVAPSRNNPSEKLVLPRSTWGAGRIGMGSNDLVIAEAGKPVPCLQDQLDHKVEV